MKKALFVVILVAPFAVSSPAFATAACSGNGAPVTVSAGNDYVKNTFSAKCSANVLSNYSQTNTAFGVVAGSQKGKNVFGGGTGGGGIKQTASCPASGCTTTEVSDNASAAARDAS